jgi:hypothetical protein
MIDGKTSRTRRDLGLDAFPHLLEGTWVRQKAFGRGKSICPTQLLAPPSKCALLTGRAGRARTVFGLCCIVGCLSGLKLSSIL